MTNHKYIYLLEVYVCDEDGEPTDKIIQIEALSEESLLEQLRKVDEAKREYEEEMEARADQEYQRQKDEGEV